MKNQKEQNKHGPIVPLKTLIEKVNYHLKFLISCGYDQFEIKNLRKYLYSRYKANPSGKDLKQALLKLGCEPSNVPGIYFFVKPVVCQPTEPVKENKEDTAQIYEIHTNLGENLVIIKPVLPTLDTCLDIARNYLTDGSAFVTIKPDKP